MAFLRHAERRDRAECDHHQPDRCDQSGEDRANVGQHRTALATPARLSRGG